MKRIFILFVLVCLLILSSDKVFAQWIKTVLPNPTTGHGALPGRVVSLEADGSNIYAGTLGGNIYLSQDDGGSWAYIDSGLTTSDINAILKFNGSLYVGTYGDGIFISSNNGMTWKRSGNSLSNLNIYSIVEIDSNLFAGTWGGGVFVSTDYGSTWKQSNSGLSNPNVRTLGIRGKRLYAGTWGDGIYFSDDYGASWLQSNIGINKLYIYSIASDGSNVYLGNDDGVYLSVNGGFSWSLVNNGLTTSYIRALMIIQPNLLAGTSGEGVFLSTNNGTSWADANTGLTDGYIYCFAASGSKLFAGSANGEIWMRQISEIITDIKDNSNNNIAKDYNLYQNYPNPFNPTTNISYMLSQNGFVTVKVFNTIGKEIETLVSENENAGIHSTKFTGPNLSSGVYFYQLKVGNYISTKKMILMK